MRTTQEQFELVKQAVRDSHLGTDIDIFDTADEMEDGFVETLDTLDNFTGYNEIRRSGRFEVNGVQCLELIDVQVRKGDRRKSVVVCDFGTHRAAVEI